MAGYKILILNYEYPPLGGGAGIITRHLAEELAASGHSVTILTAWFNGQRIIEEVPNLKIIRLKSRRKRLDRSNPLEMWSYARKALAYIRKNVRKYQFDVCLANFTMPGGIPALWMKENLNLPYVILSHGHDIPWFYPRQMFFWHMAFYLPLKKIIMNSSYNVVLTEEMKTIADSFVGNRHSGKNVVIPNGMTIQEFVPSTSSDNILKILFVGRLVEQKDPVTFIKAVSILQKEGLKFECRMLGGGPMLKKLLTAKEKMALDRLEILGKVSHDEVIENMKQFHILVAPSTHEAMSVTILEALSCGMYVITTPISGNNQLISDNGVLIPPRSPEKISEEIREFCSKRFDGNIYRRVPASRKLNKDYSWQSVAEKYAEVFRKTLDL